MKDTTIRTDEEVTADLVERCGEVNKALREMFTRLYMLKVDKENLRSFLSLGQAFSVRR